MTVPYRLPLAAREPLAAESRGVDRRVRPRHAVWEVTLRCDSACHHCGSRAGHPRPRELDTGECLALAKAMADLGVREVSLIGGEVYLREDWLEIIRAIRANGMGCNMVTGGRGLTRERGLAAARAGLQNAGVSLDGGESAHERLRGARGSFRSAIEAIRNLRAADVGASVNTQINRVSAPSLPALVDTLQAEGVYAWQVALTVPMGRAADDPDVLLQPYELLDVFPILAREVARARNGGIRISMGNNIGYFGPFEEVLRADLPCSHSQGCGAGSFTLGIEADGTVKGCPSLRTERWRAGNVRNAELAEIWERGIALRELRDPGTEKLWGFCHGCYYADTCAGGCTWTADTLLGRPGNNPYCHHRALSLAAAGKRERVVRRGRAPGKPFDRASFELVLEDIPRGSHTPRRPAHSSTCNREV